MSRRERFADVQPITRTRLRMLARLTMVAAAVVFASFLVYVFHVRPLERLAAGVFASAGVVGITIAFASQSTAQNLVSGVMTALLEPMRIGDDVSVGLDAGVVEDIGLFYTRLRADDGTAVVVPNKNLGTATIRNRTKWGGVRAKAGIEEVVETDAEPQVDSD